MGAGSVSGTAASTGCGAARGPHAAPGASINAAATTIARRERLCRPGSRSTFTCPPVHIWPRPFGDTSTLIRSSRPARRRSHCPRCRRPCCRWRRASTSRTRPVRRRRQRLRCCSTDARCDSGDVCTVGVCSHAPIAGCCHDNGECDDGAGCTADGCVGNVCHNTRIPGCCSPDEDAAVVCNDGVPCPRTPTSRARRWCCTWPVSTTAPAGPTTTACGSTGSRCRGVRRRGPGAQRQGGQHVAGDP